jgi:hypothetical protein
VSGGLDILRRIINMAKSKNLELKDWALEKGLSLQAAGRAARLGRVEGARKEGRKWLLPARATVEIADPVKNLEAGRTPESLYGRGRPKSGRSRYVGVTHRPHRKKSWEARAGGRFLGGFETEEEAAAAYNQYVLKKAESEGWSRAPRLNLIAEKKRKKRESSM